MLSGHFCYGTIRKLVWALHSVGNVPEVLLSNLT
jgi:hypothetical protein